MAIIVNVVPNKTFYQQIPDSSSIYTVLAAVSIASTPDDQSIESLNIISNFFSKLKLCNNVSDII